MNILEKPLPNGGAVNERIWTEILLGRTNEYPRNDWITRLKSMTGDENIPGKTWEDLKKELEIWKKELEKIAKNRPENKKRYNMQIKRACQLLELARKAARKPDLAREGREERIVQEIINKALGQERLSWATEAMIRLCGVQRNVGAIRSLSILFMHFRGFGGVVELEVEVMADGTGEIYPDPDHPTTFFTYLRDDFIAGYTEVWDAVKGSVDIAKKMDAKFRLKPKVHAWDMEDRSAETAFYLCLLHAVKSVRGDDDGLLLDSSSAITATLKRDKAGEFQKNEDGIFLLGKVEELAGKLEAACLQNILKVIVAEELQDEASRLLTGLKEKLTHAPIPTIAEGCRTVEQAGEAASGLVRKVMDFLMVLGDVLDETPWYRKGNSEKRYQIRGKDVAVELDVLVPSYRDKFSSRKTGAQDQGEKDVHRHRDETNVERYEGAVFTERLERRPWCQFIHRPRFKAFLTGPPGGGKTFNSRHTLVAMARKSADKLRTRKCGLQGVQLEIPVWTTANALADAGNGMITTALVRAMKHCFVGKPQLLADAEVQNWLKANLSTSRACIIIDALDEIAEDKSENFNALATQLERFDGRVLITCRTMHFEERKGWTGWRAIERVELAPLTRNQRELLIRSFLGAGTIQALNMKQLLRNNYGLRHGGRLPLILTFACLLFEDGDIDETTTYAECYQKILNKMMSGEWRGIRSPWPNDEDKALNLDYLECAAWSLFNKKPEANEFSWYDWKSAANEAGINERNQANDFLKKLMAVGIMIRSGNQHWSFLHRTLLECLAAQGLARIPKRKKKKPIWLKQAEKHIWLHRHEWQEVMRFLAGLVDDVTPFIKILDKNEDDIFGSILELQALLIASAGPKIRLETAETIAEKGIGFFRNTISEDQSANLPFSKEILRILGQSSSTAPRVIDYLLGLLKDDNSVIRREAVDVLGAMEPDNLLIVDALIDVLKNDEDDWARASATQSIGAVATADSKAIHVLIDVLKNTNSSWVRRHAVEALGRLGPADPKAVDSLIDILKNDEHRPVRISAAEALGGFGETYPKVICAFIDILKNDKDDWVRASVAMALDGFGAVGPRIDILKHKYNKLASWSEALILGAFGAVDPRVVRALVDASRQEDDFWVRESPAVVLGKLEITDSAAVSTLIDILKNDDDDYMRAAAAVALGGLETADLHVIDAIIAAVEHDNDNGVRRKAAEALWRISQKHTIIIRKDQSGKYRVDKIHRD
jgi:HEAT repeat protein